MESDSVRYKITPLYEYMQTAKSVCTLPEILALGEQLSKDPWQGKVVLEGCPVLRTVQHPARGTSARGFRPICLYIINEPDREVVLVYMYCTEAAWKTFLQETTRSLRFVLLADKIKELVEWIFENLDL